MLNRRWKGNELYLLITVYVMLGLGLVAGGFALLGALRWIRRADNGG